jgi:thiamine biosynthesis lipoprotein
MDTIVEITLFENKNRVSNIKDDDIFKKIEMFLDDWDNRFSPSSNNCEILKCNNRGNDTVQISDDLFEMIKIAEFYSEKLDGYFDISIKPLKDYWDINGDGKFLPDPKDSAILDTLKKILPDVDYKKIRLLENPNRAVFENPNTKIDLGGVAKGFAIDTIVDTLKNYGFDNFVVNIGGDIFVSGNKNGGKPIVAGIKNPRADEVRKTLTINSKALCTSGDYERFRIAKSGERVHHVFDTKTGLPISKNIALSVLSDRCVVADILSTGLFAFPAESILVIIKKFDGCEVFVTDSLQNVCASGVFNE